LIVWFVCGSGALGLAFGVWDLVIFFVALIGAMTVGFIAGRKEETSEDYFLAGRSIPWWGVAGSIFGSNVSANHMVGMMGVGLSIGFAQSHFEIGAIAGLTLLCYGFLPVYRKLNLYTLSEYLEQRYDHRSRLSYATIMIIIMALIQLVPGLYIGARSMCVLAGDFAVEQLDENGDLIPAVAEGEPANTTPVAKHRVKQAWYITFVLSLAIIAASYTILGGLKAVVWTDFIQSILLLGAGIVVAVLVFNHVGGWAHVMDLDRAMESRKMSLYLPMNHPDLPWTGVFSGLMVMHFFYWGTNQFIVQRALGARSDREARLGIIAAGFLKLLIPFFAIAGGVGAFYMFQQQYPLRQIPADTAFTEAVKLVIPMGYGLIGLIAAGLIGAILSSIDSMMNSAATLVSIDVYKRYFRPDASDKEMIRVGQISILAFVSVAALLAILVLNPNSEANFFITIADYQNYFTPGLLVAFGLGMLWRRGTPLAGFATIIAGVVFSFGVAWAYNSYVDTTPHMYAVIQKTETVAELSEKDMPPRLLGKSPAEQQEVVAAHEKTLDQPVALIGSKRNLIGYLGVRLNFFHRVVGVILLCGLVYIGVSLCTTPDPEKSRLVWTDLGGHKPIVLRLLLLGVGLSLAFLAGLGFMMVSGYVTPLSAGLIGGGWVFAMFAGSILWSKRTGAPEKGKTVEKPQDKPGDPLLDFVSDDRFWSGLLCGAAVFLLYYFR